MLFLIHGCHGAFPVDLVHINLCLTLQYCAPPDLPDFTQRKLGENTKLPLIRSTTSAEHTHQRIKMQITLKELLYLSRREGQLHWWVKQILYQHTFARLQTPQGILRVDFVREFSLHQDPLRSSLVHRYTNSPRLQVHRHLHAKAGSRKIVFN